MKRLTIICSALLALGLAACSDDTVTNNPPPCTPSLWANNTIPPCTVPVNFVVDDSANKVFGSDQLIWKGSFVYDGTSRIAFYSANWGNGDGPYVPLFDDGPWTGYAQGNVIKYGHEPSGQIAGDKIWGATVFVNPPSTGVQTWEYGLYDNVYQMLHGNGWMWQGSNGTFQVTAGQTTAVTATGMTLAAFGNVDFKLDLDTNNLAVKTPPFTFANSVTVKSNIWGWGEVKLAAAGGGIYSMVLSQNFGPGTTFPHTGLLKSGDVPEFVFVLDGTEYKVDSSPPTTGVTASTKPSGGSWTAQTIAYIANGNTTITVP